MTSIQCLNCQQYIFNIRCKAFPKKIPQDIFNGTVIHDKKDKRQKNDIIYTPIDET